VAAKPFHAPVPLSSIVLPKYPTCTTYFSYLEASGKLAKRLPLAGGLNLAVLDGFGAIKYLSEIETPTVVCVIDRSTASEAAADLVLQLRNTRGEPISIQEDLGWRPPPGVEALGFTVAL